MNKFSPSICRYVIKLAQNGNKSLAKDFLFAQNFPAEFNKAVLCAIENSSKDHTLAKITPFKGNNRTYISHHKEQSGLRYLRRSKLVSRSR